MAPLAPPGSATGGSLTYDFTKFSQKLHVIEIIWGSKILLCRSATEHKNIYLILMTTQTAIEQKNTVIFCRAMKTKSMVFKYTWVYSKEDTMAHTRRAVVTS